MYVPKGVKVLRFECSQKKKKRIKLARSRTIKRKVRRDILRGKLERLPQTFRGVVKFDCPSILSIEDNFEETLTFFLELKSLSYHILKRREYRKTTPTHYSIGLNNLEEISVRCAVILAAEIDRLRRIACDELFYQGKVEDDKEPITLLRQLGVFRLVGSQHEEDVTQPKKTAHGHRTAIPLMSGLNCDEQRFLDFESAIRGILEDYQTTDFMHSGMAEAMLNAINHGYLSKFPLRFPCSGKRWWAAAVLDTEHSELKVLVFDQGHGIAKTLPASGLIEGVELMVGKILGRITKYIDTPEEVLVKAALDSARSRTDDEKRGKGFKDIQAPVSEIDGARLRITSGKAEVTLRNGSDTVSLPLARHIGGTLIEWVVPTQSVQRQETE